LLLPLARFRASGRGGRKVHGGNSPVFCRVYRQAALARLGNLDMFSPMSLRCFFGVHRPSLGSIARKNGLHIALCEACARPLERKGDERWAAAEPLYGRKPGAA
jgi:hypothetical protein